MTPELELRMREACKRAVAVWGSICQLHKLQEECCELGAEVNRYLEERVSDVDLANEVADVLITAEQAKIILGADYVEAAITRKLRRLEQRLAKVEAGE